MTWFGISVTYIRFYAGFKKQGLDRSKLPYASRLQPYAAWYAAVMCLLVCFVSLPSPAAVSRLVLTFIYSFQFSGWQVFLKDSWASDTFVTNYFPLMLFPVLYIGSKIWRRDPIVKAEDMDFFTGLDEVEAAS